MTVPTEISNLGKEVAIGSIDKELRKLWEVDEAHTNASLINFAVYSENASALAENSEMVREITREHACRAILIGIDRECSETSIRAWITAHCHLAHGNKSICCEQLAFHLTGTASGRLRNTVFAHLNSDLPLVFWWQGELSERFNERLYSLMARLVVDSSEWKNPVDQFAKIEEAMQTKLVIQDLSWTRTYQMRLSIAALFDDPIAEASLESVQKVRIVVAPENRMSGLQLLAWMAVQAGWQKAQPLIDSDTREGAYHFEHRNGNAIDVQVSIQEGAAAIGLVEFTGPEATVRVTRNKGESLLFQQLLAPGHVVEQHAPADCAEQAELVRDQLSRGGKNSLFRKIFPAFYALLRS